MEQDSDPDAAPARDDFFANMSATDKARYEEAAVGLSAQQLQRLQNIFDRHDADKSGEIDVRPSLGAITRGRCGRETNSPHASAGEEIERALTWTCVWCRCTSCGAPWPSLVPIFRWG